MNDLIALNLDDKMDLTKRLNNETDAAKEFRRRLSQLGCPSEKLHGGIYQNGLPDLLVGISLTKSLHLVEMKVVKSTTRYKTVADVIGLLRTGKQGSRQFAVCAEWGGSGFPVWIVVAQSGVVDPPWTAVRMMSPKSPNWLTENVAWGPVEWVLAGFLRASPGAAEGPTASRAALGVPTAVPRSKESAGPSA